MRNYYEILGVQPDASPDEIKRAFKELARRDHPDKNSGSKASEEAFKELASAYAVLSDPNARVLYDVYGNAGAAEGELGEAAVWQRQVPATSTLEQAAAPLYLTRAEMQAGCAKVLPVPCPACAGRGRGIGQPCDACDGRGWSATGPTVRITVPAGIGAGETIWGEVLGDAALDPVLFAVRPRREARPRGPSVGDARHQAAATRGSRGNGFAVGAAPAEGTGERSRPPAFERWPETSVFGGSPGVLESMRQRLRRAADRAGQGMARTARALARSPSFPLAVQFAAVARALEGIGDRQVQQLGRLEHRLATDVTELRQLLREEPPAAPSLLRLEERVVQRDAGMRMAAFSLLGAVFLGVSTAWLIEAAIGDISATAPLLPGPLAALRSGWLVGVTIVGLALASGIARRLLTDLESEDFAGLLVENVPTLLFLVLAGITGAIFWHAAPTWLQRFGVVTTSNGLADALPRYGVTGAGALLIVQLYALGDWLALGVAKLASARARLSMEVLLTQRERALERARTLARNVREDVQQACAGADGLTRDLRLDFERAVGIETSGSVTGAVGDAVAALVGGAPPSPATLPPRPRTQAALVFALDLLAFALWATAVTLAAASLAPSMAALPGTGSPAVAFLAAIALPLAASFTGLLVKEAFFRGSRAALTQRALPWLARRPTLLVSASVVAAFVIAAGWLAGTQAPAHASAALAATWSGGTVLGAALAGAYLDAGLVAAGRCLLLVVLALAWSALRVAEAGMAAAAALAPREQAPLSLQPRRERQGENA